MSDIQNTETGAKKKGLGRGLGSLLGDNASYAQQSTPSVATPKPSVQNVTPSTVAPLGTNTPVATVAAPQVSNLRDDQRIWMVPVEKISPNEFQPRQTFDKEKLEELARSIKEKGILQPISARKSKNGGFEIIAGERRWRAAQLAGMHEVPVILRESSNQDSLELAIVENVQRADLDPIEEAEAFQKLGADFHLTQQQIADKVGKERATIANSLRLLLLPQEIKEMVRTSMVSAGHAKVLLGLNDSAQQKKLAKKIVEEKLSVRATEKLITSLANLQKAQASGKEPSIEHQLAQQLAEDVQKALGTKVSIDYDNGKGKISIYYYSNEELSSLTDKLKEI